MRKTVAFACAALCSVSALAQEINLIGGRPAKPGEYPEVVRIRFAKGACTAAVVGPRVLVTAAHCTEDNGDVTFKVGAVDYTARCKQAPYYTESVGDQDLAYCKTDKPVVTKYAVISEHMPKRGEQINLAGYGCTQPGGTGGNDGVLRVGQAPVTREATGWYYSFHTYGESAICFGDSGGPAFREMSDAYTEVHEIVGVNSRGDIRAESLLTSVAHQNSWSFAKQWANQNQVDICGVTMDCSVEEPPPPPPPPGGNPCYEPFVDVAVSFRKLALCMSPAVTPF